jgi:putative addiction module component (TIGR02574 family)
MQKEQLKQAAMALPLDDRIELAEALWDSLNISAGPDSEARDREDVALALARHEELATGKVTSLTHQEVIAAARRAVEAVRIEAV